MKLFKITVAYYHEKITQVKTKTFFVMDETSVLAVAKVTDELEQEIQNVTIKYLCTEKDIL